jgi:hypothetical protein
MKKVLAVLLVLGVVVQDGWSSVVVIGGAVSGAIAGALAAKRRECNISDGKGKSKACQQGKKENKANTNGK